MKVHETLAAFAAASALAVAGCGDDDSAGPTAGNGTDRAFVAEMIPHHEGAVEMAKTELDKGEDPELRTLAQEIIDAQEREIRAMRAEL